jgi:RNA polymerase sigma factor (sigma-70 family)
MQEVADMELLRQYVHRNSEEAFAALVTRHVNMVYSAALRKTGNAHAAEEITQVVFIILAKKADRLRDGTILSGWLYQTARLTAASFLRNEIRRARREQEAYMQSLSNETESNVWPEIEPLLEDAMGTLGEKERDALALRFFEGKSFQEIGAVVGASENAAKKRVGHALEKLRKFFSKRGVVSSTAIIAGAISENSVHAAPTALGKSVIAVALAKGTTAAGSTLALVKGVSKMMMWSKIKLAAMVGAAVLATGAVGLAAREQIQGGNAKIPYTMLDDAIQFVATVNQSNLVLRMTFGSKQVSPTNIHLAIESKTRGSIPVQLAADGQLLNLPHDDALRRENPFVVSDLPKGTLNMTVFLRLPRPKGQTLPYSRLGDCMEEVNRAVIRANQLIKHSYAKEMLPFKKQVQGVIFMFPTSLAGKAKVEVASTKDRREYIANARGQIKLKIEKALLDENPEVRVSHNSYIIVPDIE